MYPDLFEIGGFRVTSFGVSMVLAFLTAVWIASLQLRRWGKDPELTWEALPWVMVGGVGGAKLYYVALHWDRFLANPLGELTDRGGLVWFGGLLGGVAAYYWVVRRRRLDVPVMFDATAAALALAYAVGRLGCFLVGDDYGRPTSAWYGVAFPEGSPPSTARYLRSVGADVPASVPDAQVLAVHPTQLYEVALALVIFAILWRLGSRGLRPGQLFGVYLGLYGTERFLIEFVRAKTDQVVFGLTTSQLASLLLLGIAWHLWRRPAAGPAPVAAAAAPPGG